MAELSGATQRPMKRIGGVGGTEPLGGAIILLLIYMVLEYARPANPLAMPLIISIVLFIWWASLKEKMWTPHIICLYLLLASVSVMGPFAVNNFSIWVGFQTMFAMIACISIPMMHFANSFRKISVLVNAFVALHAYIAVYAVLHGGWGPGGHVGDENDVALALDAMVPVAFCCSLSAKNTNQKLFYLISTVLMIAGVVATNSRGGFLGLVAVLGYCFVFSPRKGLGLLLGAILCLGAAVVIPDTYWEEMATISRDAENTEVGTGAHRRKLWGVAVNMFVEHPVFGVGLNNFQWNAGDYMDEELFAQEGRSYAGTVAHSLYFTILAETGASGSLLVLAIVYLALKSVRGLLNRVKAASESPHLDDENRERLLDVKAWAIGLRGGMLGYGVAGVFLTAFVYPHFWYLVALVVALERVSQEKLLAGSEEASQLRPSPRLATA